MIGTTLEDIRRHVESLASDSGRYYLVCGRTGERPVPADGLAFESRSAARAAAQATEQYRAALRRYDPRLPYYDVIVREELPTDAATSGNTANHGEASFRDRLDATDPSAAADTGDVVDFCHTVAGVVFEAIAASDHAGLEDAVMDTYLSAAETIESPDELCLRLLESVAAELDARLDPDEQAALVASAAADLPTADGSAAGEPLAAVLAELQAVGLLESYRLTSTPADGEDGSSWTVTLRGYALAEDGGVVTLPLVVALLARVDTDSVRVAALERGDDPGRWRLDVTTNASGCPQGLVRAREEPTA